MLRIGITSQTPEEVVLKVEGWVVREAVGLLEQEGQRWLDQGRRVVLDLGGVRFIDRAGLELLASWVGSPIALRGGPPFVRAQLHRRGLVRGPDTPLDADA
jgi:anti-anti-sigma regulatory factor